MTRIACLVVPGAGEQTQQLLLELALAHSPSVEDGGPGIVYLDLRGLEGLFGGEKEIARRLLDAGVTVALVTRGGRARRRQCAHEAADDGLRQFRERPDRGDGNRAGADESHLMTPDVVGMCGQVDPGGRGLKVREDRHGADPRDDEPHQHRQADRETDEMSGADERE